MTAVTDIRAIAQLGAPVLWQPATPIGDMAAPATAALAKALLATLASTQGVGLAAPQISESVRMMVVASKPTPRYPSAPLMAPTLMINPDYEVLSDNKAKDWEGCLSIPGIRAQIPRYTKIAVRYWDLHGDLQTLTLEGFVARIFQHEYDHLDGLVYLDRVESNRDIISEVEFQKRLFVN